jgi:membrane protein DedA with SNARE-associated domain
MTLLNWTISYISHVSYLAILIIFAIAGTGVPIPEDVILLVAGYLASPSAGVLSLSWTIPVCILGIILADNIGYRVGKYGRWYVKKIIPKKMLKPLKHYFKYHGAKTIFISRFLTGIRPVFPIMAGMTKMHWKKFFIYDALGGMISVPIVVLIGYFFGFHLAAIVGFFKRIDRLVVAIFIIVVLAIVLKKQIKKIKRKIFEHARKYSRMNR